MAMVRPLMAGPATAAVGARGAASREFSDEHLVRSWRKPDRFGAAHETPFPNVQGEIAEAKELAARHNISANLSKTLGTTPADHC